MAMCDGIRESRSESGVFHLKGIRQRLIAPGFPFVPARLWCFLVLTNPESGEFPCYIRVVNDRTDRTVFYGYLKPRPSFGVGGGTFPCHAPIRCAFSKAGTYTIPVWFFQMDRKDVLKGEMTFSIVAAGEQP